MEPTLEEEAVQGGVDTSRSGIFAELFAKTGCLSRAVAARGVPTLVPRDLTAEGVDYTHRCDFLRAIAEIGRAVRDPEWHRDAFLWHGVPRGTP